MPTLSEVTRVLKRDSVRRQTGWMEGNMIRQNTTGYNEDFPFYSKSDINAPDTDHYCGTMLCTLSLVF